VDRGDYGIAELSLRSTTRDTRPDFSGTRRSAIVALVLEAGFVGVSIRALAPIASPVHS